MTVIAPNPSVDLSPKEERRVARQYMGRIQWEMILIGVGQCAIWLTTFIFVIVGRVPLWLGFLIATVCLCLSYLPSHEGQHGNLSGRRPGWRWLDPVVGQITLIPLRHSHELLRVVHLKHHAHTNDAEMDPDYWTNGDHWWQPALNGYRRQGKELFAKSLQFHAERDPAFAASVMKGLPVVKALALAQLVMVVLFPLPTLLVWWLPNKIAFSYLSTFFSWEPHRPGDQVGRYLDTRFWRNPIPRFFVQSMQTHVIHHLYPTIPHWDEPKALEALRPYLIERGVSGMSHVPRHVRFNPLIGRPTSPGSGVMTSRPTAVNDKP